MKRRKKWLTILPIIAICVGVQAQTYTDLYVSGSLTVGGGDQLDTLKAGSVVWYTGGVNYTMDGASEHQAVDGTNWYISPTGDDATGTGAFGNPWQSWDAANDSVQPGDTVWYRGGTYNETTLVDSWHIYDFNGINGTAANPIVFINYPGEVPKWSVPAGISHALASTVVLIRSSSHLKFIGLELDDCPQVSGAGNNAILYGWNIVNSDTITLENCTANRLSGVGFAIADELWGRINNTEVCDSIVFDRCDAIGNEDPYSPSPYDGSDGFRISHNTDDTPTRNYWFSQVYYLQCLGAWNSDDGIDFYAADSSLVVIDQGQFIYNGYNEDDTTTTGNGNGLKLGPNGISKDGVTQFRVTRTIAAMNRENGFDQNTTEYTSIHLMYNNLAYGNGNVGFMWDYDQYHGVEDVENVFYNNAVLNNTYGFLNTTHSNYIDSNNTWNGGVTCTEADYASLDSTTLGTRDANGDFVIDFGTLDSGSDLIDAAKDVGYGTDIGPYEYTTDTTKYYVSNSGSDANDGNNPSRPLQTIAAVNALTLDPGDQILFKRGDVWRETDTIQQSGSSGSPIVLTSYGTGAKPRILGSEQATTFAEQSPNIWWATFDGSNPSASDLPVVVIETDGTINWVDSVDSKTRLTEEYLYYWATAAGDDTLFLYAESDPDTRYGGVEVGKRIKGIHLTDESYIVIDGLDIRYSTQGIGQNYTSPDVDSLVIKNSLISFMGIREDQSSGMGMQLMCNDFLAEYDTIGSTGRRGISANNYSNIDFQNFVIRYCKFYDGYHTTGTDFSTGAGSFSGDIDSVLIHDNYFYQDENAAVRQGTELIWNQGPHGGTGTLSNVYIYKNIFRGAILNAIPFEDVDTAWAVNNTIINHNYNITSNSFHVQVGDGSTEITVAKNIMTSDMPTDAGNEGTLLYVPTPAEMADVDENLYYRVADGLTIINTNSVEYNRTHASFDAYVAASGWDDASPYPQDPMVFLDNYKLRYDSPARDSGTTEYAFTGLAAGVIGHTDSWEYGDTISSFAASSTQKDSITITASGFSDAPDSIRIVADAGNDSIGFGSGTLLHADNDSIVNGTYYYDSPADTSVRVEMWQQYYNVWSYFANIDTVAVDSAGSSPLLVGLEASYSFEESSGDLLDNTDNNNDGTVNGTWTREVTGQIDNCYTASGDDWITIGSPVTAKPFTFACWVKADVSDAGRTIIGSISSGGPHWNILADESPQLLKSSTTAIGTASSDITNESWQHVAVTYDGSGNYAFYLNGSPDGSGTNNQSLTQWSLNIGRWEAGGDYFLGELDELHIWSVELSADDISDLYDSENGGTGYPW